MGEQFIAEAPGRPKPLVTLPRGRRKDQDGVAEPPVVEIDVNFGKRAAGCCLCNTPIPPDTTRISIRVWLRTPVSEPGGRQRVSERYYAHPGCMTERVRPEVIRSRMDCYDCGALPPQRARSADEISAYPLIYWGERCFTVSKFASAPLCSTCVKKPRWKRCDSCTVYFPHWMISEVAEDRDVPAAHLDQYSDLRVRELDNICEFCSSRLGVSTVDQTVEAKANFEKLRAEIAAHGIFEAGE